MPRRRSIRSRGHASAARANSDSRSGEHRQSPPERLGSSVPAAGKVSTSSSSSPRKRSYVVLPFGIRVIRKSWYIGLLAAAASLLIFSMLMLYVVRQQMHAREVREARVRAAVSTAIVDVAQPEVAALPVVTSAKELPPNGAPRAAAVNSDESSELAGGLPPVTLELILEKHRTASSMSDVNGAILRGRYVEDGRDFALKLMAKSPDLVRKDLRDSDLHMVYSFDGQVATIEVAGPDRELHAQPLADELHQQVLMIEGSLFALCPGVLPDELIFAREPDQLYEGRTCWTIRRRVSSFHSMIHLIDSETGLESVRFREIVHAGQTHQISVHLSDYRSEGEGLFPYAYTLKMDGQVRGQAQLESVKLDPGLMPWMF